MVFPPGSIARSLNVPGRMPLDWLVVLSMNVSTASARARFAMFR